MRYRQSPIKIFLSHASEDKAEIAKSLADALMDAGFDVWYDEYSLELGDSLKMSIDKGLADCDLGVVILSEAFFSKKWTQDELGGLIALEVSASRKVILPVWHKITHAQVSRYSPTLADRIAATSDDGIHGIVAMISKAANHLQQDRTVKVFEMTSKLGGNLVITARPNSGRDTEHLSRENEVFDDSAIRSLIGSVERELSRSTLQKRYRRHALPDCSECGDGKLMPASSHTGAKDGSFVKHSATLVCDRCGSIRQT